MRQVRSLALIAAMVAGPATAQTYSQCEKSEIAAIAAAVEGAHDLALQASVLVGDTLEYRRWFGDYSRRNGDFLRRNLKSVYKAIVEQEIHSNCRNSIEEACKGGTYAFVNRDTPWVVNFCPPFFGLPTMTGVFPGSRALENGTQEGTIIHEMSHFEETANTDDLCYSRGDCEAMARTDPNGALRNADSYQYYAEDVIFFPPTQ